MADRTIGSLPHAPDLYDDSLLVIEQQGAAMSLSGAQLKGFARQGVEDYVEDAKSAAQTAQNAAQTAQNSAQTAQQYSGKPPIIQAGYWWTWNAQQQKYVNTGNEATGPVGPQGLTGATGPEGPPGEKGEPGTSFTVLGRYDTLAALKAAHPTGSEGEAWAVGSAEDNEIYLWDVHILDWNSVGSLQGPPGPAGAGGVTSFNGRTGDVKPAAGDYTAAQVGALSQSVADNRYIRPGEAYPDASYTQLGSFSFGDDGILVVGNGELNFESVRINNITYLRVYGITAPDRDDGIVNKAYVDGLVGDISSVLDSILGEVV